ncbi:hypothetical protein [Alienimonas californiensis]|uniref:Uncharacterized protein n=1 Tax=Alienimonas californiensis TaxID=2527989 RepID=A0A517P7Z5_9PLAN|nr:hypothetical protein [Alienimonas californiensis]QDT15473.1 hypothetical protein CA12_15580 [Alienimonas californiensis]
MRRPSSRSLPFARSLSSVQRALPEGSGRFALALAAALVVAPAAFARQAAPDSPAAELAEEAAQPDAAQPDPNAGPKTGPPLPRGIQPPPTKPESMKTVTPLVTEQELKDLEAAVNRARYRDVLEVGPTNADNRAVIENWAKWRVAQLTGPAPPKPVEEPKAGAQPAVPAEPAVPEPPGPMVEDRRALAAAVAELIREANRGVGPRRGGRGVEEARLAVFPILAAELVKLKDNHLVLRTQAIKALSRLEVAGDGTPSNPFKRFGPALGPLLEIYKATGDSEPELAVKYQAAAAIAFVAENGRNVPGALQFEAANLFASDLVAHPEYPGWMQGGLATAVARLNLREPELSRKLLVAVQDESRPFEARTRAAAALVRLPGAPSDVKGALPTALENLGRAMAKSYNTRPSAEHVENFRTLEFAFKPIAPSEVPRLGGGAILSGETVPSELLPAYSRLHPLVKHVAGQNLGAPVNRWTPIPADLLANAGVEAAAPPAANAGS